jgi:non-homologous end joining protein Ku
LKRWLEKQTSTTNKTGRKTNKTDVVDFISLLKQSIKKKAVSKTITKATKKMMK